MSLATKDTRALTATSSRAYAWLPFAAALCLVVTGPFLNSVWTSSYREYYSFNFPNSDPPVEQLRAGAEWAVDVASAIPNCVLTLVGLVFLDLPVAPQIMVVTCVLFVVVLFTVTLYVSHRRMLTAEDRTFRNLYSPLGWLEILLNLAGLVTALALR